ncbi:MAG TPA: DUF1097 domain-containing protein [Pseudonocardia sp.]|jgi:hypothetical protein|nr:DUF1097 domain-containing protein [Pseudonocardia sp.]
MSEKTALTISIGVLGAVAVVVTGSVLLVPVWVVFIAWASFFIVGGGLDGLKRSVASNLTGSVLAGIVLLINESAGVGLILAALVVGLGSAAMVQASRVSLLSTLPAIVWGFASTVGTQAVTDRAVTTPAINNPWLMAVVALLLGAVFGIVSERAAALMNSSHGAAGAGAAASGPQESNA